MLRGSKPGERRGGRQRFTPNRRTILADTIVAVGLAHPNAPRRAFLAQLVKDQKLPADIRMAITPRCFPVKRARSCRTGAAADFGGHPHQDAEGGLAKGGSAAASKGLSLQELDVLVGVVQDVGAAPKVRRKAALKIAEFLLPKAVKRAKAVPDEFGFRVNPSLASCYRDVELEIRSIENGPTHKIPAVAAKLEKLRARSAAILTRLQVPCPTKYTREKADIDQAELNKFTRLRDSGIALSEAQELVEAHLKVRLDVFAKSPESIAHRRRKTLQEAQRLFKKGQFSKDFSAPAPSRKERNDLKLLRWLYPERKGMFSGDGVDAAQLADRDEMFSRDHPFQIAVDGNFYPPDPKLQEARADDSREEIHADAPSDDADDSSTGVNFRSWLLGEVKYPPHMLRSAAKQRFGRTYPMDDSFKAALIEDLVRDEQLVSEDQVCAELARYLADRASESLITP